MQKNLSTENEFPEIMEVDYIRGSFMFFRAAALEEAGYFDDHTFLYFEEPIVCTRLNRKGYRVGNRQRREYGKISQRRSIRL